jgi:hypothetical protein
MQVYIKRSVEFGVMKVTAVIEGDGGMGVQITQDVKRRPERTLAEVETNISIVTAIRESCLHLYEYCWNSMTGSGRLYTVIQRSF